jgi:hypothetical protein
VCVCVCVFYRFDRSRNRGKKESFGRDGVFHSAIRRFERIMVMMKKNRDGTKDDKKYAMRRRMSVRKMRQAMVKKKQRSSPAPRFPSHEENQRWCVRQRHGRQLLDYGEYEDRRSEGIPLSRFRKSTYAKRSPYMLSFHQSHQFSTREKDRTKLLSPPYVTLPLLSYGGQR